MSHALCQVVLWLFVINLGIAFGAGLYESRIMVPQWLTFTPGTGYRCKARQWARLGLVRHAATLVAGVAALKTFALFYETVST